MFKTLNKRVTTEINISESKYHLKILMSSDINEKEVLNLN